MFYIILTFLVLALALGVVSATLLSPKVRKPWMLVAFAIGAFGWGLSLFAVPAGVVFWSVAVCLTFLVLAVFAGEILDVYYKAQARPGLRGRNGIYDVSINSVAFAMTLGLILILGIQIYGINNMVDTQARDTVEATKDALKEAH